MAPIVDRFGSLRGGRDGAIAQLGERVVRNDEVGGSIPPGSTSLRLLRKLRLGKPALPYRSEASEGCRGVARRAKPGLGNSPSLPRKLWRPLLHKTRYPLPEIAPLQRDLHFTVGVDG